MLMRVILVRLSHALLSMLVLSVLVFLVTRLTGDPLNVILPDTATPEDFERVRAELGLDEPIWVQYGIFIADLFQGDLGRSYRLNAPVAELIAQRFGYTVQLALAALALVVLIGVPLGVYAAYRRGGWTDRIARGVAVLGQAAPQFWIGLLLIWVFAVNLGWFPAGGHGKITNLILPAISIAFVSIAGLTRLIRSSMIEVLESDFIKFLRLQGMPEPVILWKHALRNAGLTAMTFVGVLTASLLTGSVVVETVFSWPGLGELMTQSIYSRDFPTMQAIVLVFVGIYITINLLVDVLYVVLNPRLR